ncbi:superinfection immunity protein, partial [Campylobacter coli]
IKFLFKENYMEGASGGSIFVTILLFVLYMLPAIIGLSRKHSNWLIISLLNLFLVGLLLFGLFV